MSEKPSVLMGTCDFYDIVEGAEPDRNFGDASPQHQQLAADWAPYLHIQPHRILAAQALGCLANTLRDETAVRPVTALEAETIASLLPVAHQWLQQGFLSATPQAPTPIGERVEPLPLFNSWVERIAKQTTPTGVLEAVATTAKTIIDDHTITTIDTPGPLLGELDALASYLLQSS